MPFIELCVYLTHFTCGDCGNFGMSSYFYNLATNVQEVVMSSLIYIKRGKAMVADTTHNMVIQITFLIRLNHWGAHS